jgi:hypothetical protein
VELWEVKHRLRTKHHYCNCKNTFLSGHANEINYILILALCGNKCRRKPM